MSIQEIHEWVREHPSFDEWISQVEKPSLKAYSKHRGEPLTQIAEWIFESGRRFQDQIWRDYLISHQEKESDGRSNASRG